MTNHGDGESSMIERTIKVGDRVFVENSRVHHYTGTVVGILPRRVRVEFPRGGYGDTPYIEDFYANRLVHESTEPDYREAD